MIISLPLLLPFQSMERESIEFRFSIRHISIHISIYLVYFRKRGVDLTHNQHIMYRKRVKVYASSMNFYMLSYQIRKLENINVDPYTAWQSSKLLQAGLSHHHIDNTNKHIKLRDKDGNLTAKPADQVQILGEFFSKQIFGRNSAFEPAAVNKLRSIPVNTAIADPITMDKLKTAPGPNSIIIEQYKLLTNDENLTFILEIINNYVDDPVYDIPEWHDVSLKLLPKKVDLSRFSMSS